MVIFSAIRCWFSERQVFLDPMKSDTSMRLRHGVLAVGAVFLLAVAVSFVRTMVLWGSDSTSDSASPSANSGILDADIDTWKSTGLATLDNPSECMSVLISGSGLSDTEVDALRKSECDTVALWACWQDVRRNNARATPSRPRPVDAASLSRFIGFVEGRLRVLVPWQYEDMMLSAIATGPDDWIFRYPMFGWEYYADEVDGIRTSNGVSISEADGVTSLSIHNRSVTLPFDLCEEMSGTGDSDLKVTAELGGERLYVVTHVDRTSGGRLWCIQPGVEEAVWMSEVWWQLGNPSGDSGRGYVHQVMLTIEEDTVVVWGAIEDTLYMQCVSRADGKCKCVFSTRL